MTGLRLTSTGRSVVAGGVLIGLLGLGMRWVELVVLGAAALCAVAVAVLLVLPRAPLEVHRVVRPRRVHRHGSARGILTISQPSTGARLRPWSRGRGTSLAVHDRVAGTEVEVRMPPVGRVPEVATYPVPTWQRGRLQLGPLTATRSDPLGLVSRTLTEGTVEILWVLPHVHDMVVPAAGMLLDLEGAVSDRAIEGTVTAAGIRPYVVGDDLRLVHWRSTARTGDLMMRQMVDTTHPELAVVLDTRTAVWNDATFEEGVDLAASVVRATQLAGQATRLIIPTSARTGMATGEPGTADPLERLALAARHAGAASDLRLAVRKGGAAGSLIVVSGAQRTALTKEISGSRQSHCIGFSIGPQRPARAVRNGRMLVIEAPDAPSAIAAWNSRKRR